MALPSTFRYCPICRSELQQVPASGDRPEQLVCRSCGYTDAKNDEERPEDRRPAG